MKRSNKKAISFIMAVSMVASAAYSQVNLLGADTIIADTVSEQTTAGEMSYKYDEDSCTLTISGNGPMVTYGDEEAEPWADLKESIKKIVIEDGITSISRGAFDKCTALETVEIPDSVSEIKEEAFSGCSSLTKINIPDKVTVIGMSTFENCSSLKEINLPENLYEIQCCAFGNCTSLTKVTVPDSTELIWGMAFSGCTNLSEVKLSDNLKDIYHTAFDGCDLIGETVDGIKYIDNIAYDTYYIDPEEEIENIPPETILPENVIVRPGTKVIAGGLFDNNTGKVKTVSLPDSVEFLSDSAFSDCHNMQSVNIPESVSYIGKFAFNFCENLKSITIPDNITEIKDQTFRGCVNLKDLKISDKITDIGDFAFFECYASSEDEDGISYLDDIACFAHSTVAEDEIINLRSGTRGMTGSTYCDCPNISSIVLPDGLIFISDDAINQCPKLRSVTIPASVTTISDTAIADCENLSEIYGFKGTAAETYAKNNNLKFIALDSTENTDFLNNIKSNNIDMTDLTKLSLYIIGDAPMSDEEIEAADVNKDGSTDLADLATCKQFIMKDITSLYVDKK